MNNSDRQGSDPRCGYMRIAEAAIHARTVELGMFRAQRAAHQAKQPGLGYGALCDLRETASRAARLASGAVAEVEAELRAMPDALEGVATALLVGVAKNRTEAERCARFVAALAHQAAGNEVVP